jgi:predicted ATPase
MFPEAIILRNYRSFASPVCLELRPITLLFGINNSGKSALLRALPLLGDSVNPATPGPLDLESPAMRGGAFHDLRWKGVEPDEDPDLTVRFQWAEMGGPASCELAFHWFEDWRRLVIRKLGVQDGQGRLLLEAVWKPVPQERTATELTYEIRTSEAEPAREAQIGFRGMVPATGPTDVEPVFKAIGQKLLGLHNQIQWLVAARRSPERLTPRPAAPRWRMKPDGADAAAVLAGNPEVLADVSGWYERNLGRILHVQEVPPNEFRLMVRNPNHAALDTDLADNGEGTIQVLPVLTALALTRHRSDRSPGLLAIEEPESHLHPSLQRALAAHLCDVVAENKGSRVVLETHSEHLLLGVQLQILQGRLRPEDALVYWVRQLDGGQSVAERVAFDEDARFLGAWPPEVFSDDTDLAREIITARRERARP